MRAISLSLRRRSAGGSTPVTLAQPFSAALSAPTQASVTNYWGLRAFSVATVTKPILQVRRSSDSTLRDFYTAPADAAATTSNLLTTMPSNTGSVATVPNNPTVTGTVTVSASSEYNASYTFRSCINGAGNWATAGIRQNFTGTVVFSAPINATKIMLQGRRDAPTDTIISWVIEASNDNFTTTDTLLTSTQILDASAVQTFNLNNGRYYTAYRFKAINSTGYNPGLGFFMLQTPDTPVYDLDTSGITAWVGAGDGTVLKVYNQINSGVDLLSTGTPKIVIAGVLQTSKTNGNRPEISFDGASDLRLSSAAASGAIQSFAAQMRLRSGAQSAYAGFITARNAFAIAIPTSGNGNISDHCGSAASVLIDGNPSASLANYNSYPTGIPISLDSPHSIVERINTAVTPTTVLCIGQDLVLAGRTARMGWSELALFNAAVPDVAAIASNQMAYYG